MRPARKLFKCGSQQRQRRYSIRASGRPSPAFEPRLAGGSPNELAPALKHWKEAVLPTLGAEVRGSAEGAVAKAPPLQLADLTHELWQRALAAAAVEIRGGPTARHVLVRAEGQTLCAINSTD